MPGGRHITCWRIRASDAAAMPGQAMVFAGCFPTDAGSIPDLREALNKLQLSCGAEVLSPKPAAPWASASACGFLGLLHNGNRAGGLEREYNLTCNRGPSVILPGDLIDGSLSMVDNPATLPDRRR